MNTFTKYVSSILGDTLSSSNGDPALLFPVYLYLHTPWSYLGFMPLFLSFGAAAKLLARTGATIAPSGTPIKLVTTGLYLK
ncbi:MAG: hypothetical protein ACJA0N_001197 [Pseudohongiellaceae bacterium]|jgi:hypothetical protein